MDFGGGGIEIVAVLAPSWRIVALASSDRVASALSTWQPTQSDAFAELIVSQDGHCHPSQLSISGSPIPTVLKGADGAASARRFRLRPATGNSGLQSLLDMGLQLVESLRSSTCARIVGWR